MPILGREDAQLSGARGKGTKETMPLNELILCGNKRSTNQP